MSNKVKIILLMSALSLGVVAVFNVTHAASGEAWAVSLPVAAAASFAASLVYRRTILGMTNDSDVVVTDHGPDGRIEAIEVFWRPG